MEGFFKRGEWDVVVGGVRRGVRYSVVSEADTRL